MRIFSTARIVVVDSDAAARDALCRALAVFGLTCVRGVGTAEAARELDAQPEVCVMVSGPGMLPASPFDPEKTAMVLIAADAGRHTARDAKALGYRYVMAAPVVPRLLYRRIGSILQKVRRVNRASALDDLLLSAAAE